MAAAYLFSPARNHAFNDGNKRVAAIVADVFLLMNGFDLTLEPDALADTVLAVADGTLDKGPLAEVIRAHLQPAPATDEPA